MHVIGYIRFTLASCPVKWIYQLVFFVVFTGLVVVATGSGMAECNQVWLSATSHPAASSPGCACAYYMRLTRHCSSRGSSSNVATNSVSVARRYPIHAGPKPLGIPYASCVVQNIYMHATTRRSCGCKFGAACCWVTLWIKKSWSA